MTSILELAQRVVAKPYASTYYRKNSAGKLTSWCQEFIGNTLTEAGVQYSGSYASANASRAASTIASKDPTKAPPGAIHYFVENHVTLACGPSGRMIGATPRSAGSTKSLGKSVYEHNVAGYPLTYVGWSYANGTRPRITGYTDPYMQPVAKNQRMTNVFTKRRTGPDRNHPDGAENFPPQTVVTPQGWINGEAIDGTAVWFKIDGLFSHASTFTDRGTHDVPDLNTYAGMRVVLSTIPNGSIRADAATSATKLGIVTPNQQVPVTRYKRGELVTSGDRTTDIWFEVPIPDAAGKGFSWAGSFTDPSTKDLTEIKPVDPTPEIDYSRKVVGTQALNVRQYPTTSAALKGSIPLGTEIVIGKYTRGDSVSSASTGVTSDIWYVVNDGVAWSGGFDSQSVEGLEYIDIQAPVQQYPTEKFFFAADFPDITSRVVASDWSNWENEYSQPNVALRKGFSATQKFVVRHQWGAPGAYSLESVLNTFMARHLNSDDKVSPHFTIGINTLTGNVEIIQNLPLSVRAYHAGSGGNDYIGVEIDPRISDPNTPQDLRDRLVKAVRTLEEKLAGKYNERLTGLYHQDLPGANTACGQYIKPVAALLDAEFEGDSDEPYDWDAGFISVLAAIEASKNEVLAAMPKSGTITLS